MVVNHVNGNKTRNYIDFPNYPDNLEWTTRSENEKHAYVIGIKGSIHNHTKSNLTEETVHKFCSLLEQFKGIKTYTAIGRELGMTDSQIHGITGKRTWKYIYQINIIYNSTSIER